MSSLSSRMLPTPNPEEVVKFKALYRKEYGKDLTDREALKLCTVLFQFVYLVAVTPPPAADSLQSTTSDTTKQDHDS